MDTVWAEHLYGACQPHIRPCHYRIPGHSVPSLSHLCLPSPTACPSKLTQLSGRCGMWLKMILENLKISASLTQQPTYLVSV